MPEWTKDQLAAIDGRAGSLVVSAAAGSGKTTVLVERVIRRLSDTQNRCPADKLIIVTFTRAAAAQMKERIEAALEKKISQGAGPWLMQQQILLQSAKICTVDSFCADLVRENFHELGISADFSVADESEKNSISQRAMDYVNSQLYSSGDKGFLQLVDSLSSGGSDKGLSEAILRIYETVSSHPFEQDALDEMFSAYFSDEPVEQSCWGAYVLEYARKRLTYSLELMSTAQQLLSDENADKDTVDAYSEMVSVEKVLYENLLRIAQSGGWDELKTELAARDYCRFPGKRKIDPVLKDAVKRRRDKARKIADSVGTMMCCTADEFVADRLVLRESAAALKKCVGLYISKLRQIKKQEEKFDFNDIEHLALDLLVKKDEKGIPQRTALAQSMSENYVEIMVDEYQDTNELQDMIFTAVSRKQQNLFFVGDVKQSIYRFRQAMPEIFLKRRDNVPEFDGSNYPARVNLAANFRSRKGVTAAVNFLFGQIMSPQVGDVEYNEKEQLNPLASYPEHDEADVEFCLRRKTDSMSEAEFVADYIEKLLSSGVTVGSGESQRQLEPGDICILTRNKKPMAKFAQALERKGIPAKSIVEGKTASSAEVRMVISLLHVLDNPLKDIELTAVMMSPVFGFDSTELARLRTGVQKGTPVYRSVFAAAGKGDEKCARFLERIDSIRRVGIGMGAAELLRKIYGETDIIAIAKSLSYPEQRVANLYSLLDCAASFDASGKCGLSAFLRFIEKADGAGTQFDVSENSHAVKVMNIHKSKGLEFPVCILADLDTSILKSERSPMSMSREFGPGLLLKDTFSSKSVHTLPFAASELESKISTLSEEVRILYVALTRAKEKLVFVATVSKPEERMADAMLGYCCGSKTLSPGYTADAQDFLDWLLPVFGRHADAVELYSLCEFDRDRLLVNPGFPMKAVYCNDGFAESEQQENCTEQQSFEPDEDLARLIDERLDYIYPYSLLADVVPKKQASGFMDESFDDSFFAVSRPAFMNTGKLTAAQKGTLAHKFMQLCDFSNSDVKAQIELMVSRGELSGDEAKELRQDEIEAFFSSGICRRINASPNVMREKKFALLMPVTQVYPELSESFADETIVVKGMLDLAFEEDGGIVIVDYKTDRGVDEAELIRRHAQQLEVYVQGVERCTDYKVKEAYIYSLSLKKEIKVR